MILENVEGLAEWNIAEDWHRSREPGLSAMVRLKDESQWCVKALRSIEPWCDEIVVALQGEQSDGTDDLVLGWEDERERWPQHVRVLRYPFDSLLNGPGHDRQPKGSVHERAYFYNWCLAKTTRTHVVKWDGDMVAFDWLGFHVRRLLENGRDFIRFDGVEIVSDDLRVSKVHPRANMETRVFPARPGVHFITGSMSEVLIGQGAVADQCTIKRPGYLHYKWAKGTASATKAWPANWRDIPHFQRIAARAEPGDRYDGELPSVL